MPAFITYELTVLRCAERVVHSRGILVIGQVVNSDAERKRAVVKFEPTLNVHVEIEICGKARRIRSSHNISLRILNRVRKSGPEINQVGNVPLLPRQRKESRMDKAVWRIPGQRTKIIHYIQRLVDTLVEHCRRDGAGSYITCHPLVLPPENLM